MLFYHNNVLKVIESDFWWKIKHYANRSDRTSGKTFGSSAGGMGFISRADQISHMLPMTRHRCNLVVWALAQSRRDGHRSLVTPKRVLSEY